MAKVSDDDMALMGRLLGRGEAGEKGAARIAALLDALNESESKLDRYRWIPVDERLPPDEMSVLAFKSNGHVDKTCRYAGGWLLPSLEPHVTHWMPLPEPPK